MKARLLFLLFAAAVVGGCSTSGSNSKPLIPNQSIQLTAKSAISLSSLATGAAIAGAIYLIYDPLAPNWDIEESRLNDDTYRFSMKMKRYHTGGAGESMQALKRRASQLQYEQGFASYEILEYNEGIDSQTLGARRTAEGTIRLVQRQQADSFRLN
ncbi:MAG: hypothetical protein ACM3X0_04455 [Bacteroidota bacterium]